MLAEERRLFYVAVTRPRQRLVVTAVQSPDDDGEQPSRFLTELGHDVQHRIGRPRRPLSIQGLVAELRRTVADPEQPQPLREAAAARLRLLATTEVHGRAVAPSADPATWWGLRSPSRSLRPVRPDDRPVTLSASALEGLLTCPAQWFLTREAGGQRRVHGQPGLRQGGPRPRGAGREGRARRDHGRGPDALRRRGVGPDGVPDPVVARARARGRPGRAGAVPRVAPPTRRPHRRRDRAEAARRGHSSRTAGRRAPRLRRPARARRAGSTSWSSTSRPASTHPPTSRCPTTRSSASTSSPSTTAPPTSWSAGRSPPAARS